MSLLQAFVCLFITTATMARSISQVASFSSVSSAQPFSQAPHVASRIIENEYLIQKVLPVPKYRWKRSDHGLTSSDTERINSSTTTEGTYIDIIFNSFNEMMNIEIVFVVLLIVFVISLALYLMLRAQDKKNQKRRNRKKLGSSEHDSSSFEDSNATKPKANPLNQLAGAGRMVNTKMKDYTTPPAKMHISYDLKFLIEKDNQRKENEEEQKTEMEQKEQEQGQEPEEQEENKEKPESL